MNDDPYCYLEINSFSNWQSESAHIYGDLNYQKHKIALVRSLSARQARKLNQGNIGKKPYKEGSSYPGFDTYEELISCAIKEYRKHFPDAYGLLLVLDEVGITDV